MKGFVFLLTISVTCCILYSCTPSITPCIEGIDCPLNAVDLTPEGYIETCVEGVDCPVGWRKINSLDSSTWCTNPVPRYKSNIAVYYNDC